MKRLRYFCLSGISLLICSAAIAQKPDPTQVAGIPVNYDESKTGDYTLPDLLTLQNGKKVNTAADWTKKRRPEILALYQQNQFGKMPARPRALKFDVFDKGTSVLNGTAIRKQVTVYFSNDTSRYKMELLVYLPAKAVKPAPLLLQVSFAANSNVIDDPGIKPSLMWSKDGKRVPVTGRPGGFGKVDPGKFISQGYGFATLCYTDIEPDSPEGLAWGIRSQYLKPGKAEPAPDEWGSVSAWAWGISRAIDYFETDKQVDSKRIAIQGTSRLGKTVLWAGASDTRIAMVIASCSGEGGAALSRRNYGETIAHLTAPTRYPYQFAANYGKYAANVGDFPMDAHMLVALMAPRPLLLQTGDTDNWSDPKGEFLSAIAAAPVYNLFGKNGPSATTMPAAGDASLLSPLGYYMHKGGHGTVPGDWDIFVDYLKKYL